MTYQVDFNDLPVVRHVRVMQGDSYGEAYELWLNEVPLSLVGATVRVGVRRAPGKGTVVMKVEVTPDNAGLGQFTVRVPATVTEGLLGEYRYEVEIEWAAGSSAFAEGCTKTVLAGALDVYEDVLD